MEVEEIVEQIYLNRHPEKKFLKELKSNFIIKLLNSHPNQEFYMIGDNLYIQVDYKEKIIHYRYTKFAEKIIYEFYIENAHDIIESFISKEFNLNGYSFDMGFDCGSSFLENNLKNHGILKKK
jgi:hypothetical protein